MATTEKCPFCSKENGSNGPHCKHQIAVTLTGGADGGTDIMGGGKWDAFSLAIDRFSWTLEVFEGEFGDTASVKIQEAMNCLGFEVDSVLTKLVASERIEGQFYKSESAELFGCIIGESLEFEDCMEFFGQDDVYADNIYHPDTTTMSANTEKLRLLTASLRELCEFDWKS